MQTNYKTLSDIGILRGKRIILRLDLNVPIVGKDIRDDFRIRRILPTIAVLKNRGARVIIISHIESKETNSLEQVSKYINGYFPLRFIKDYNDAPVAVGAMKDGDVLMLENLRINPGEKTNDENFAKKLAKLGDIYVNDAFSVSHRVHASVVALPKLLPSCAGLLMADEIEKLSTAFNPPRPFLFIIGGAKLDTKMPLVRKFLKIADYVFVGGALANNIYRERGYEIGDSLVSDQVTGTDEISDSDKLVVPSDVVVTGPSGQGITEASAVNPGEIIVDAGPATIANLSNIISKCKFVLWNGPLGDYEHGFARSTEAVARAIAQNDVYSIVGGGDTIAVLSHIPSVSRLSFVSTGGGAMLEFLAKGTLPGIEALKN